MPRIVVKPPSPLAVVLGVLAIATGFVAVGCWCFGAF